MDNDDDDFKGFLLITLYVVLGFLAIIIVWIILDPIYTLYSDRIYAKIKLEQAIQDKKILLQEAKAHEEADIERAKGTAAANKIIGDSLKDNPDYLKWAYINKLSNETNKTVIYVPTDGMVPTLEAGRIGAKQ